MPRTTAVVAYAENLGITTSAPWIQVRYLLLLLTYNLGTLVVFADISTS